MKIGFKKKLLAYLEEHNDGSETADFLIRTVRFESDFADCDSFGVCTDDLDNFSDQEGLRKMLGKDAKSTYNDDDCQKVANLLADEIAEEFGETLANIIANRT